MSRLSILVMLLALLFAFQNCGEVSFSPSEDSIYGKAGAGDLPPGPEVPDILDDGSNESDSQDSEATGEQDTGDQVGDSETDSEQDTGDQVGDSESDGEQDTGDQVGDSEDDGYTDEELEELFDLYACGDSEKERSVYVCHFPRGNPEALHTICIGLPALEAHLHHEREETGEAHDFLGTCESLVSSDL